MLTGFISGLILGISYYDKFENKNFKLKINGILYSFITFVLIALFTIFFTLKMENVIFIDLGK